MEDQKVSWEFMREHILPRLTDLEEEVRLLRKVCWPVCQALTEPNQISNMKDRKTFLAQGGARDLEEVSMLLRKKSEIYHTLGKQGGLLQEESSHLAKFFNNTNAEA